MGRRKRRQVSNVVWLQHGAERTGDRQVVKVAMGYAK